jgi:hypothetical protein
MSIIPTAESTAMGFSDQQLVNPTNKPLPIPPAAAGEPKTPIKVEQRFENLKLHIRRLELYRKLLETKAEVSKSASSINVLCLEQDLSDYWKAVLETNNSFEELAQSIAQWQRQMNGSSREVYNFFSLNVPKKIQEHENDFEPKQNN